MKRNHFTLDMRWCSNCPKSTHQISVHGLVGMYVTKTSRMFCLQVDEIQRENGIEQPSGCCDKT